MIADIEKRLRGIIASSMDAVIVMDEKGKVLEWNPAAEAMFGWSFEEVKSRPLHDLIIPEELKAVHKSAICQRIKSGSERKMAKRIETIAIHKDGHQFPVDLAMASVKTEDGWMFNAFIRDMTEQKEKEDALFRSQTQLLQSQKAAKLGYWEFNITENQIEWSDEIYRIMELDPKTSKPSYDYFISILDDEDRERVVNAYKDSIKYKTPYNVTYRIQLPGGREKIIHEQCETEFGGDGRAVRSLGIVQDITDRESFIEELRLASTTFMTHAGIMITDKDGVILRVNPAFEAMTGYYADELIGNNPRMLQSGLQDKNFYTEMWNKITENGVWEGEIWDRKKNGDLYAQWLTITAVKDESNQVTHYVATCQDITDKRKAETQIEYLAYHDELTRLPNRRLLLDRLEKSIANCKRRNLFGALLLLDLDRFKDLNDSLGHSVGDELLRSVALRLSRIVREGDTVARLGGDEFVVMLPTVGNAMSHVGVEALAVAEKIQDYLSEPYTLEGVQYYVHTSIGITLFPEDTGTIDDILKHADSALYRAKEEGRNTVSFYQPSMQLEVDRRLSIGEGIRDAIRNNEFFLLYQPQLNSDGQVIGAEALLRWRNAKHEIILPNEFIPIAEDTGLILDVGRWVFNESARQVSQWIKKGVCDPALMKIAINVSPRQFRQDNFVDQVIEAYSKANVSLECIELEITETVLMHNTDDVIAKIKALREYGVRVAIDDFGVGYSSLTYLKQIPLDLLKIDQSFVRDVIVDKNDAAIVETIISMASHLELGVIAEGVETKEQFNYLLRNGCACFQGLYFSGPLSVEEFESYIQSEGMGVMN